MAEGESQFNAESMVQDVLQQHGKRLRDINFASRKAQETSLRRYEATGWLRKMVGVVLGKDLPAEPSVEDFRLGLRSGIILCNALNKVQPGAVSKIVEAQSDTVIIHDGFAHTAFQYFENIRNFLVAIEHMGIPSFQASDLEKGGESSRIVNCVLALKSYHEWKQCGGNGHWKFSGNSKPSEHKQTIQKNSDLFLGFVSRHASAGDGSYSEESGPGSNINGTGTSHNLQKLVREILADKNQEDIPEIVEHMLSKLMEEFEHKLAAQNQHTRTASQDNGVPSFNRMEETETRTASPDNGVPSSNETGEPEIRTESHDNGVPSSNETGETEIQTASQEKNVSSLDRAGQTENFNYDKLKDQASKCQELVERQQRSIQELKNTLHSTKEEMQTMQLKYQEQVEDLGKHMNTLAHAAAGYRKVQEENRKLYNQVQDLKGNIRVYCRVRPFLPGEQGGSTAVDDVEERAITLFTPSKHGKGKKTFTFNRAFGPSSSQEEVFADTQPLIRSVLDGYNVCIFAYGQTGSGKTFTMTGPKELTNESLGVNYRALNDLFLICEERTDTISYEISVQMIEIYNEQVRDLLVTDGTNKKLEIRNNAADGINVPNANRVTVKSPSDVIHLMNLGHNNRAVGSTSMNDRSSRSHSCLTVHIQGRDLTSSSIIRGCMHLVDLAGSERADKTDATGDRLKEAQHINRSLSALGDVISSLAQKQSHVPYRNSKLTQLLQDSLGGQAKTLMFVHISPDPDALGETLSTLKFAERVSTIELGAAKANKGSADVKELKDQIASLKASLARKEGDESLLRSPDSWAARSVASSAWNDIGDACKTESDVTSRRHSLDSQDFSLDSQDLVSNSPSWPMLSSPEVIQGPETVHPKSTIRGASKDLEQSLNKDSGSRRNSPDNGLARTPQYETTTDLDEAGPATSDSSEADNQQQQLHVIRSRRTPNVVETKIRKPSPKPTKSQERSPVPQPTKKALNGSSPASSKSGKQTALTAAAAAAAAARRKPVKGK